MKNTHKLILVAVFLMPNTVIAATQCNYIELAERFEVVCLGDEKTVAVAATPSLVAEQAPVSLATPAASFPRNTAVNLPRNMATSLPRNTAASDHSGKPAAAQTAAVNAMLSYRENHLTREIVDSKKAIRMKNIQLGK